MGPSLLKILANQVRWAIPVLVCSGGTLVYLGYRVPRPLHPIKQAAAPPTILEAANTSLGLAATRRGHDLVLSWNTESPAIVSAVTGILVIQTRGDLQDFILGPGELRSGSFLYKSTAEQINIRLHLFDRNDKQTNDVIVIPWALDANQHPASQLPPEPNPASVPDTPSTAGQKKAAITVGDSQVGNGPQVLSQAGPTLIQKEEAEPPAASARDVLLETPPLVAPQSFSLAAVPQDLFEQPVFAKPPSHEASGLVPVVTMSPLRPKINAIPLFRKLSLDSGFVPPTPIRKPSPELPASISQGLRRVVLVDVKVFVGATGDVQYAELLSNGTGPDREIASFAVFESRGWKFDPARLKGQSVDGEVILHYRFSPSTGPEHPVTGAGEPKSVD